MMDNQNKIISIILLLFSINLKAQDSLNINIHIPNNNLNIDVAFTGTATTLLLKSRVPKYHTQGGRYSEALIYAYQRAKTISKDSVSALIISLTKPWLTDSITVQTADAANLNNAFREFKGIAEKMNHTPRALTIDGLSGTINYKNEGYSVNFPLAQSEENQILKALTIQTLKAFLTKTSQEEVRSYCNSILKTYFST